MATQAFEVLRGTTTIAASGTTATITESTDYTLPTGGDSTNCFIKINNTRLTGMGDTVSGGVQNVKEFTVRIDNPGNIATSINFIRSGTPGFACRVTWEILCYVGASGGNNEMIVRDVGLLTGSNVTSLTSAAVTGIAADGDVAVIITSQSAAANTNVDWHAALWTADWDAVNDKATFARQGGTPVSPTNMWVSYAVLEFTGSNWSGVDRVSWTAEATTWAPGNNNNSTHSHGVTIADLAKAAVLQVQYDTDNDDTPLQDSGDAAILTSTTVFTYWNRNLAGIRTKVAWLVQNTQASGTARNLKCQHLQYTDDTSSAPGERVFTQNFSTDPDTGTGATLVAPLGETSCSGSCSGDGAGPGIPMGSIDIRLTGTNEVTFTESFSNQERRIGLEIIEWPEDEAAAGGRIMSSLVGGGGLVSHGGIAGSRGGLVA